MKHWNWLLIAGVLGNVAVWAAGVWAFIEWVLP